MVSINNIVRFYEITEADNADDAKARAESQGFDTSTIWYHGTTKKFASFRIGKGGVDELGPGIYFTKREYVARAWGPSNGGRIIACYLRRGNYFDLDLFRTDPQLSAALNKRKMKRAVDDMHPKHSEMMNNKFGPGSAYDRKAFVRMLSDRRSHPSELLSMLGYTGAYDDQSQIPDQIVIFNPRDARRVDAKFHPDKTHSERLLDDETQSHDGLILS